MPVIRGGFVLGIVGPAITALGCWSTSGELVFLGLALCGAAQAIVLLSRAAAAEMFAPERRARGMSFVLFGAVSGAVFGPLVFGPLFADRALTPDRARLAVARLVALRARGAAVSLGVRQDPKELSQAFATRGPADGDRQHRCARSSAGPASRPRSLGAVSSFAVMVGVMNLAGYVAVGHGHQHGDVFTVISAHIVGMYGLVLVVGDLVDRIGRTRSMAIGLAVMAVVERRRSSGSTGIGGMSLSLFGLGLGWNLAYVAATTRARLARRALRARAPGRLLRPALELPGAALALGGGVIYTAGGSVPLAVFAAALAALPAVLDHPATIRRRRTSRPPFLREPSMKTYSAKPGEITRDWYVVDAEGQTLGPSRDPDRRPPARQGQAAVHAHVDTGDFVVVVNAEKIAVTGNKLDDKLYYRHSGYPGGLKERPLREQLERRPTEVLRKAVKGMLPRNKLARQQITKLKIYAGPEHPHEAQAPKPF